MAIQRWRLTSSILLRVIHPQLTLSLQLLLMLCLWLLVLSHSLMASSGMAPSHSPVHSVSTSGADYLTALRMFHFSTALPITIPTSSVSISGSNAASGRQVVVNGTRVNFNFTASNPGQTKPEVVCQYQWLGGG